MATSRVAWILFGIFFTTTVIFVVVFSLAYAGVISVTSAKEPDQVCTSQQCVEVSSYYYEKINWQVDPCDDFFEFACGKWIEENPIPGDATNYQTYSVLRNRVKTNLKSLLEIEIHSDDGEAIEKAKNLYSSCTDEASIELLGVQPLVNFLVGNLTWPVLRNDWSDSEYDEIGSLATLQGGYSNDILVDFYVGTDDKNSSLYVLKVDQATLAMTDDYYLDDVKYSEYQNALKSLMIDIACMLSEDAGFSDDCTATNIAKQMTDAFEFEIKVAQIKIPSANRTSDALYNKMTLGDMENAIPGFPWTTLANEIIQTRAVTSKQDLIVRVPAYFTNLVDLLNDTSKRTKQNYMVWRIVKNRANNLGQKYQNRLLEFNKIITGQTSLNERWYSCVDYVDAVLPGPTGNLFITNYFQEEKKETVHDMVNRLKTSFKWLLDTGVDWMDEESKVVAREKCDYIDPKIGYAEFYKNKTYLAEDIKNIQINSSDYFGNVVHILSDAAQQDWQYIDSLVDKESWSTPPTTVNAYYSPTFNRITFPAGELQYPFFWGEDYLFSFQFGAIGTIIGHEITHAFDNNGRQYDKNGNRLQWWTDDSIAAFNEETQCLVDQYNNYYWETAGDYLDGENTLGENIADNGGLRESFYAYKEWVKGKGEEAPLPGISLNHDQMFFIGYANVRCGHYRPEAARDAIKTDVHSPGKFRVIGSMSNFDEFSKAFSCSSDSNMNRGEESCVIW